MCQLWPRSRLSLANGKDHPLPWILHVQCTRYKLQRSAERGRGTHIVPNPHRRAEVFGALLEIDSGPWPVNVASYSAAKPNPPLQCQTTLGGMFPRWYHNLVTSIRENILAHNNPVYNLTIFRWTKSARLHYWVRGAGEASRHCPIRLLPPLAVFEITLWGPRTIATSP